MTLDQQIQVWNAVGTWFAGIATFAAVLVSLHLARKSERVRLKANAGIRLLVAGDGTPPEEHLEIGVTNLGDRAVTVTTVGWTIGKGKKRRYCIQTVSGPYSSQYPIELAHGKRASFLVSFKHTPNWGSDFAKNFVESCDGRHLKTLTAQVHTSVGQIVEVKPEPVLLEYLKKAYANV